MSKGPIEELGAASELFGLLYDSHHDDQAGGSTDAPPPQEGTPMR